MHKTNNNNIKVLGYDFHRNNLYRFFWSMNILFVLVYMALSYFTVSNIIERKQVSVSIENMRADIGNLESEYFSKMAVFMEDENNIKAGFSEPENVTFAKIKSNDTVSLISDNGL